MLRKAKLKTQTSGGKSENGLLYQLPKKSTKGGGKSESNSPATDKKNCEKTHA